MPQELAEKYTNEDNDVIDKKSPQKYLSNILCNKVNKDVKTYKIPLYDSKNKIKYILGIIEDITEGKMLDRAKSDFISMVNHELRTPLTSIMGGLGIVLHNSENEEESKLLNIVNKNAHRLLDLINDVLDIEKMTADKMVYKIEELDLNDLIAEACDEITPFAKTFKTNFEKNLSESCKVSVDKIKFIQAITNLLSNAIKYSSDNIVRIKTEIEKPIVKITVSNLGEEIPQDFVEHVFDKFCQANSTTTKKVGGTGLGLTISKMIIEKFNGKISFKSNKEQTSFTIELPILSE